MTSMFSLVEEVTAVFSTHPRRWWGTLSAGTEYERAVRYATVAVLRNAPTVVAMLLPVNLSLEQCVLLGLAAPISASFGRTAPSAGVQQMSVMLLSTALETLVNALRMITWLMALCVVQAPMRAIAWMEDAPRITHSVWKFGVSGHSGLCCKHAPTPNLVPGPSHCTTSQPAW